MCNFLFLTLININEVVLRKAKLVEVIRTLNSIT